MAKTPTYELLKKHSKDGLKILYLEYGKKLFSYAVRNWELEEDDAWELVYECLYKVCNQIDRYDFEDEKKFASFLFTVFINLLRNRLRRKDNIRYHSLGDADTYASHHTDENSEDPALEQLREALDQLEDWEKVLLLLRSQEMPYSEIEKYTQRPAASLKVYYARLKDRLLKKLTQKDTQKTGNDGRA